MRQFLLSTIAISCIATSYASDGCVTVKKNGNYSVGCPTAPKAPQTPKGPNGPEQPKNLKW